MKEMLIDYDMQFFAEDEADAGEEAQEVAEPAVAPEEGTTEEDPKPDQNAMWAAARREAEAKAKASYENRQKALDERVASRFQGLKNPKTGEAITGVQSYFDALDAQEEMAARQQLQKNGVDPAVIDKMIQNSPMMRQAEIAIEQTSLQNAEKRIAEEMREILSLDSSLNSEQDIVGLPNYGDMVGYVSRTGASIVDAYKVFNMDRIIASREKAATQATINSAKSKGHLAKAGGIATPNEASEIPVGERERWKEWYPDKSEKERTMLYNKALSAKGE